MFWRLRWAAGQLASPAYREHKASLESPLQFYRALLQKLLPGISPQVINLTLGDGHVIPVREFMTLYIYKEIFIDRCYDVELDRADPTIVDIGANTGLFALRLKQLFPAGTITCYEPFPPNYQQLQATIELNALSRVQPVQKAVGARNGVARLYIHRRNVGGHSLIAAQASSTAFVNVEVIDLETVLAAHDAPIDLLKADCEGAEFDILMSITAEMAKRIRRAIIEPMPRLYDVKRLCAHMQSLGYERTWQHGAFLFIRRG